MTQKMPDLDDFNRKLIDEIRQDNQQPARILADKVGLSVSAVTRRLRQLRATGVIIADVAVVDPKLTGSAITMHVLVRMAQAGRQAMDTFARDILRHREVTGAWEVTGDEDYVLKVQVASMADYDAFTRSTLDERNNVHSFKTLITIRTVVEDDASTRPLLIS